MLRFLTIILVLFLTMASSHADSLQAENLFTQQPTVAPSLAMPGKHAVGVKTITLTNPNQLSGFDLTTQIDRALTVEVWYPAKLSSDAQNATYKDETRSGQAFLLSGRAYRDAKQASATKDSPLIILSHGYTGYRSMFFDLGEHLASHGYVVASIDHTDSTNKEIDFPAGAGAGFLSTLLNRARDQQFVMDTLMSDDSEWADMLDQQRAAVLGYSMGGYGALNTVGGCYDFPLPMLAGFQMNEQQASAARQVLNTCAANRTEADPRWKAVVTIAPWGGEAGVHTEDSLANLTVPALFIAGELDDVSGYENGVAKLFEQTGSKDKYMLVYENARHNIAAHPAPQAAYGNDLDIGHYFEPAWSSETINRINNHMVLAFLNCHVNGQADACSLLPERESSDQLKQADGKMSPAWPGFQERWATGLQFKRGTD